MIPYYSTSGYILAVHLNDRGSNASLAFFVVVVFWVVVFIVLALVLFSFLSLTESITQHLPNLSIKSQRTVDLLLYCIAKFNLFL